LTHFHGGGNVRDMLLLCDVGHTFCGATSQRELHLTVGRENMKLVDTTNNTPKRKPKPKPNQLDYAQPFLELKSLILNNKIGPFEEKSMMFDPADAKQLEMKAPWRVAADKIKKLVRSINMESEYYIRKYETAPGSWVLLVRRVPPMTAISSPRGRKFLMTQEEAATKAKAEWKTEKTEKPKAMPPKRRRAAG
jgi:hypothetical protein